MLFFILAAEGFLFFLTVFFTAFFLAATFFLGAAFLLVAAFLLGAAFLFVVAFLAAFLGAAFLFAFFFAMMFPWGVCIVTHCCHSLRIKIIFQHLVNKFF